jgi:hypothetical protein
MLRKRSDLRLYQCTLPLAPGAPGVNFPSSDTFSPGTVVADVAVGELESLLIESPDDAQPDTSEPISRSRTVRDAMRSFTAERYVRTNLMQAAASDRFCGDVRHRKGS